MSVSLEFLKTLTKEARNAYEISKYLMDNPTATIGQASKWVTNRTWSADRLANGLQQVSKALDTVGGKGGDFARVRDIVSHGSKAAEAATQAAAATTGGGIVTRTLSGIGRAVLRIFGRQAVSGAAALGTGIVVTTVVLGAATYAGATYIGSRAGDDVVQPGPSMFGDQATPVVVPNSSSSGMFAVFVLPDNSGGTIWIGSEEHLKTLRGCGTPYGGLCDDPTIVYPLVRYQWVSQDFATHDEAVAAHCAATTQIPGYWGNKSDGYGGQYWSDYFCP